jgi:hypothetical protein
MKGIAVDINTDQLFENAIRDAVREGVKSKFSGYNSPLDAIFKASIDAHSGKIRQLFEDAIATCITDQEFRETIATEVRRSLAKLLVRRFGGELEKQVNVLKRDPATRARLTLAIEEIVKSSAS